jgi:hypothetical protein
VPYNWKKTAESPVAKNPVILTFIFFKDRIEHDNIVIQYCPAEQMLADIFTKPLQGALFQQFKRIFMGFDNIDTLYTEPPLSSKFKERVANNQIVNVANLSDLSVPVQGSEEPDFQRNGVQVTAVGVLRKEDTESHESHESRTAPNK